MNLANIKIIYTTIGYVCGFIAGGSLFNGGDIKIGLAFACLSFVAFYFKNTTGE